MELGHWKPEDCAVGHQCPQILSGTIVYSEGHLFFRVDDEHVCRMDHGNACHRGQQVLRNYRVKAASN